MVPIEVLSGAAVTFLCLAFVTLWTGKATNESLAKIWCQAAQQFLNSQFAHVDDRIRALSYSEYEVFASGRRNVSYCLLTLNLIPRQETFLGRFAPILLRLLHGSGPTAFGSDFTRDKTLIEIGLRNKLAKRFTLIIGRRLLFKTLLSVNDSLRQSVTRLDVPSDNLAPWLCILGDSRRAVEAILSTKPMQCLLQVITAEKHTFISLHISDLLLSERWPQECDSVMRLAIAMKENSQNVNLIRGYLGCALELVDALSTMIIDQEAQRQIRKSRLPLMKAAQDEVDALKKEAARAREKDDEEATRQRLAQMSPAERQRYLDKKKRPKNKRLMVKI